MQTKAEQMKTLAELGVRKRYEKLVEDVYTKIKEKAEKGSFSHIIEVEKSTYGEEKIEELLKILKGDGFSASMSGASNFGRCIHITVRWS